MGINLSNEVKGTSTFQNTLSVNSRAIVDKSDAAENAMPQTTNTSVSVGQLQSDNAKKGCSDKDNQDKKTGETSMMSTSKDVNKLINKNTVAEFGFFENTNKVIIKIKDKDTNEVIKEIPSEKALEIFEKALELAGILVDEKR